MVTPTNEQTNEPTQVQTEGESLDHLLLEAGALDGEPDDGAAAREQAQAKQTAAVVESTAGGLLEVAQLVKGMLLPLLSDQKAQRLDRIWNADVLGSAAHAGAAIMQMNGWSLGETFSKYGPYVMLFGVLAGPVVQTRRILQEPDPKPAAVPNGS